MLETQTYVAHQTAGFVTHTIRETENLPLLDSSVTNTTSLKTLCAQANGLSIIFLSPVQQCIGGFRYTAVS